jgi:hypothetical protein
MAKPTDARAGRLQGVIAGDMGADKVVDRVAGLVNIAHLGRMIVHQWVFGGDDDGSFSVIQCLTRSRKARPPTDAYSPNQLAISRLDEPPRRCSAEAEVPMEKCDKWLDAGG